VGLGSVRGNLGAMLSTPIVRRQQDPVAIPAGAHGPDDPPRDSEHSRPQITHRGAWAPGPRDVDAEDMVNTGRVVMATRARSFGAIWDPYRVGHNMPQTGWSDAERAPSPERAAQQRAMFAPSSPVPGVESEGV
jgi:hypothetical protein